MRKWIKDTWNEFLEPIRPSESASEGLWIASKIMIVMTILLLAGYGILCLIFSRY